MVYYLYSTSITSTFSFPYFSLKISAYLRFLERVLPFQQTQCLQQWKTLALKGRWFPELLGTFEPTSTILAICHSQFSRTGGGPLRRAALAYFCIAPPPVHNVVFWVLAPPPLSFPRLHLHRRTRRSVKTS